LSDVRFVSSTEISARIPTGLLKDGKYKIYITKAVTGEFWELDAGLTVSNSLPFSIAKVKPSILPTTNAKIFAVGSNFITSATYSASLVCRGGHVDASQVTASSDTQLSIEFSDLSAYDHKSCVLSVQDKTNGFVYEFNGVAVMSNNQRPGTILEDEHPFPTALCGSSAVSASIGEHNFLYVIGGDKDASCLGKSTVNTAYFAEIDNDKDDSSLISSVGWTKMSTLPYPVSFAQAQLIDTYIYIVGGYDGTSARNSTLRAQILQPDDAPKIQGIMRASLDGKLPVGHYLYAVTAVYKGDDSINPGGQSLASNIVSLYVAAETATPYLFWTKINDGAVQSYRVFRANAADGKFSAIAEVTDAFYTDVGASGSDGVPPVLGSLGNWAIVSNNMHVSRCGHVSATLNPSGNDKVHYLFSFGGSTDPSPKSAAFGTYESTKITMKPATAGGERQTHTVNAWTDGEDKMKGQHLWSGVMLDSSNVGYTGYQDIILGPGADDMTEHQYNYAENNDNFDLDDFVQNVTDFNGFGYCMFVHDSKMVMVAGSQNTETLAAVKSIYVMNLNAENPQEPLTKYDKCSDEIITRTVYPACTRIAGYLIVIGGKGPDSDGLLNQIQFFPG